MSDARATTMANMSRHIRWATLAVAVVALSGCTVMAAEPAGPGPAAGVDTADWMQTVFADHQDVTLGQVLIPGTHDSGTSGIVVSEPCGPTFNVGVSALTKVGAVLSPCIVTGLARTQTQTVGQQLEGGIRYLDLRVGVPADQAFVADGSASIAPAADPAVVPFVLQHVLVSLPLREALDQIIEFSARHPKEQVILDFQHLDLPDSTPQVLQYYLDALDRVLTAYAPATAGAQPICASAWSRDVMPTPDAQLASTVTIGQAWKLKRNLIVLVDPGQLPDRPCYRDRRAAILSPWPDTEFAEVSAAANQADLQQRQQRLAATPPQCLDDAGQNWCGFFVNQMQLTIKSSTQKQCTVAPNDTCSLFAFNMSVNAGAARKISDWRTVQGLPVNIVILDYYNFSDPPFVPTMIELNRRMVGTSAKVQQ